MPNEAEYRAALGWALFSEAPADARAGRAALGELRRALQLDGRNVRAYQYLAQLYAQTGQPELAVQELERLLAIDPGATDAAEELRRLRGAEWPARRTGHSCRGGSKISRWARRSIPEDVRLSEARRLRRRCPMTPRSLARARYSADLLARVAEGWRGLWENERQGVIRSARIAGELTALGAPPAILTMAARVVQDQVRHVGVCARVLEELDAAPRARLELAIGMPVVARPSEAAVARTLVAEFALGKPLEAASFASARATVREPLLAWAYTEFVHDGARHATFGAKAAAWVIRHWSPRERHALWTRCLLATGERTPPRPRHPDAEVLGLLPPEGNPALPRWLLPHLAPLRLVPPPANDSALVH